MAGDLRIASPMLFCFGFLSMFLIGGLTGIMLAVAPIDYQLTDSYFVVGHFHWVIIGGTLFGVFAGLLLLVSQGDGPDAIRTAGALAVLVAPRRFHSDVRSDARVGNPRHAAAHLHLRPRSWLGAVEPAFYAWGAHSGAELSALRLEPVCLSVEGAPAGDDPWDAWTLDWATTSPPPSYNFETIPTVRSRRPLWDLKHPDDPDWKYE